MKAYLYLLTSALLFANSPSPVAHVDTEKFSGLWYEIARTYNSYEKDCVASTVEYALQKDNTYTVYNRCFKDVIGGDLTQYTGSAEPADGSSMSEIEMTYYYLFTQRYRVIYLEKDYSVAVVADKEMEQVWLMSRKPTLEKPKLTQVLATLEKSMDLKKLIFTPQDEKGRYK